MNQTSHQSKQQTPTAANKDIELDPKTDVIKTDALVKDVPVKESFYDFYLAEHQNIACRRLHFAGSSFELLGIATAIKTRSPKPLLKGLAAGYACAWVGHFFFEKNEPASFNYPLQSFFGDLRMYGDVLRGHLSLKDTQFDKIKQFDKVKQK